MAGDLVLIQFALWEQGYGAAGRVKQLVMRPGFLLCFVIIVYEFDINKK